MNNWLADKINTRRQEAAVPQQQAVAESIQTGIREGVGASVPVQPVATSQASVVADRLTEDQRDKSAVVLFVSQIEIRKQARGRFNNIDELAESIRQFKQRQSIVVRQIAPNRYVLVHGERRLRAIRDVLKQDTIFARIADDSDNERDIRFVQLTENLQREDYEPLELATELAALKHDYSLTNNDLADMLKLSKGWISKKLSLLEAPVEVRELIASGELSETEFYNNKERVLAKVNTAATREKPAGAEVRTPMVSIPMDVALELAELLRALAVKNAANPIDLSAKPTKKELVAILTSRVGEIRGLLAN